MPVKTEGTKSPAARSSARPGPTKTLVWFQGGGPLGSFGCGAWRSLSRWLTDRGDPLVAVGGGSIGALNAAVIVTRLGEHDCGTHALEHLWRHEIATPSWPFAGWAWGDSASAQRLRGWNGLLTGMLVGNGLYRPRWSGWTPWGEAHRWGQPVFNRDRMRALLARHVAPYRSPSRSDVLLAVSTSDVQEGVLHLHDSDRAEVGPDHLLASSALPALFEPVALGSSWHWDGDVVRDSPLPAFIAAVRRSGRAAPGERVRLVTVELLPRPAAQLPGSGPEVLYRAMSLMQAGRLAEVFDAAVEHVRIVRPSGDHDALSGLLDHSPERVDELIREGELVAASAVVPR